MKKIPLTSGKVALVDDEDYPLLSRFRWFCAHAQSGKVQSAQREIVIYSPSGGVVKRMQVPMQYFVIERPPNLRNKPMLIDHKNRNPLDCRKENLRWATRSDNASNWWRRSRYGRGVARLHGRQKFPFQAALVVGGIYRSGGVYATAQEARDAYDRLVDEFCPEFGMRNRDHWRERG